MDKEKVSVGVKSVMELTPHGPYVIIACLARGTVTHPSR